MKKFNPKEILIPTVSLLTICICMTFFLGLTNKATAQKIDDLSVKTAAEARLKVLDSAKTFSDEKTSCNEAGEFKYYEGYDDSNNTTGYIFTVDEKGYGGTIEIMVGINNDGSVHGVTVLDISETAGLGMNAKKTSFLSQYIGKSGTIGVAKNNPSANEIQALTGATITSKAVTAAVNDAIKNYQTVKGGAVNG